MELVIWGLLIGMVGMVWCLAAATLMDKEHRSKEHEASQPDPQHQEHASSSSESRNHQRVAA